MCSNNYRRYKLNYNVTLDAQLVCTYHYLSIRESSNIESHHHARVLSNNSYLIIVNNFPSLSWIVVSTVKLFDLHLYFEYTVYNSVCGGKYQLVEGEHIDNLIDEIIQCLSHKLLLSSGLNRLSLALFSSNTGC